MASFNPLPGMVQTLLGRVLAAETMPGVQYTDPPGDAGWFGPDSAIWYVHGHFSAVLGGIAGLYLEPLHPAFAAALVEHSLLCRDEADWREGLKRLGQSASFTAGVTYGSTQVAEHLVRTVRTLHEHVTGVLPDGQPYAAGDPQALRFGYATLAYGLAMAHQRYHPRPLHGAELDRFFADWAVIAKALGAADLPITAREVEGFLASTVPQLAVSEQTLKVLGLFEGALFPLAWRPAWALIQWGAADLLPAWARRLYGYPPTSPVAARTRRALLHGLFSGIDRATGGSPEQRQALQRIAAPPWSGGLRSPARPPTPSAG